MHSSAIPSAAHQASAAQRASAELRPSKLQVRAAVRRKHAERSARNSQALGHLRIESPPADAVAALWQLIDKYEDLPMDFCDASLTVLAQTLKINRIATTDVRDFSVYCLPGNKRFIHVLDT